MFLFAKENGVNIKNRVLVFIFHYFHCSQILFELGRGSKKWVYFIFLINSWHFSQIWRHNICSHWWIIIKELVYHVIWEYLVISFHSNTLLSLWLFCNGLVPGWLFRPCLVSIELWYFGAIRKVLAIEDTVTVRVTLNSLS